MSYFFSTITNLAFSEAIERMTQLLSEEGFGILTTIDVQATLKKKLDADFRKYTILGACNPPLAHQALLAESHIGLMLPCNVVVQELDNGQVEIAAVDPVQSMQAIQNNNLGEVAQQVRDKLEKVINNF